MALIGAKTAPGGTDISSHVKDAAAQIEACLEIMAKSKDLYHTELQEDLREKVAEARNVSPAQVSDIGLRVGLVPLNSLVKQRAKG